MTSGISNSERAQFVRVIFRIYSPTLLTLVKQYSRNEDVLDAGINQSANKARKRGFPCKVSRNAHMTIAEYYLPKSALIGNFILILSSILLPGGLRKDEEAFRLIG